MIDTILLAILLSTAQTQTPSVSQEPASTTPHQQPAPHEGMWHVEVIDRIKVMSTSRVTMTIEGATISGSGPCNSYRGSWTTRPGDGGRIGQLLKTMKACDGARMSEEGDYFALLDAVVSYEVRGDDTLILKTSAGKTITARRATTSLAP